MTTNLIAISQALRDARNYRKQVLDAANEEVEAKRLEIKRLDAEIDARLAETGLTEMLKQAIADETAAQAALETAYAAAYAARQAQLLAGNEQAQLAVAKGVSVITKTELVVQNQDAVPEAFKLVDLKLVKQGLKEGLNLTDIPGVSKELKFEFRCEK